MGTTTNLQSLVNAKAALDLGLVNEEDYNRVKESFLKAQQLRSAIDAGLIEEGDQVQDARQGFVSMVLGSAAASGGQEVQKKVMAPKASAPAPPPMAPKPIAAAPKAPPPMAPPMAPPAPPMPSAVPKNIPKSSSGSKVASGGKSMSGISLSEDAVNVFYLVRSKSKFKWVIWKVNDDATEVVIDAVGAPSDTYTNFLNALPEDDCRYAVYDYDFVGPDGQTHSKIVFINWAPDIAKVKSKMMYASTKDFFKSNLEGLSVEFQGCDFEEISEEEVGTAVRALKKNY